MSKPEKFAGFWIRLVADILDSFVILGLVSWGAEVVLHRLLYFFYAAVLKSKGVVPPAYDQAFNALYLQVFDLGILFLLSFPYYVWGHYRYGTTLGKLPFGIYVVDYKSRGQVSIGQSILRFMGYLPSYLIFGCGFLMAAFNPEKRALHDLIASTVSVIRKKPPKLSA
ncbi:RDD family protein [bacterium]|nr:RDD family protein [bacterium]